MKPLFSHLVVCLILAVPFQLFSQNLDVEGNARIGGLGGSGTQMVVTDNDGNLSTQAIPGGGGSSVWSLNGVKAYYNDGNVGIGTNDPDATLHLVRPFSTSVNEPMLKIDNNSNQTFGAKTGLSIFTSVDGNTGRNGIQNVTSQASTASGTFYGIINNNFPGGSGESYGIRNLVANSNTPTGMMYGINNNVVSHPSSSSSTYGIYNLLEKNGTGKHIGIFNKINGSDGDTALVSINTDPDGFSGFFKGNFSVIDGEVGIGTTNPLADFQVAGDARIENILVNKTGTSFTDAIAVSGQYQEGLSVFTQFFNNYQTIYGVKSEPSASGTAGQVVYGVYSNAGLSSGSTTAYGVYASKTAGGSGSSYALYVNGDAFKTGAGTWTTSDRRLKKDIRPVERALDVIQQLQPSTYFYQNGGKYDLLNLPKEQQYGFIAQDVEEVMPDLVKNTLIQFHENVRTPGSKEQFSEEYKAMNYEALIPILTQGIKEQQEEMDKQEVRIKIQEDRNRKLEERIDYLQKANTEMEARLVKLEQWLLQRPSAISNNSTQVVPISDAKLNQNEPNPFDNETRIKYTIPKEVMNAELYITTLDGKLVKTIPIQSRGLGQTVLQAHSLSPGTYTYALVLDGKIFETKKMILTR